MAYVIELPDGQLMMTLEPSMLDVERAAIDPLKLAIPHGLPRGRTYCGDANGPNYRMWIIAAEHAASIQEVFKEAGCWLAWVTYLWKQVFVPSTHNGKPITVTTSFDWGEYDDDFGYNELIRLIKTGVPGSLIAQNIMAKSDLLDVLHRHITNPINPQIALALASAKGEPRPRTKPSPPPSVNEAGDLHIAYISRSKPMPIGRLGTANFYQTQYRFSLIADPNNFCGSFAEDKLVEWAERIEQANFEREKIPPSLDVSDHYRTLDLVFSKATALADARRAFAQTSLKYHPDHNGAENAAEMFGHVLAAWEFFKRAFGDKTGRVFRLYDATLKIKAAGSGNTTRLLDPVMDEHLTARYLSANVMCGMLIGSWVRHVDTGEIIVTKIDDIQPLKDSQERLWLPTSRVNAAMDVAYITGEWLTLEEYARRPLVNQTGGSVDPQGFASHIPLPNTGPYRYSKK